MNTLRVTVVTDQRSLPEQFFFPPALRATENQRETTQPLAREHANGFQRFLTVLLRALGALTV
jgi:hypothetical protein